MPGPTVTLTFAGDSAKLEKAFDNVGGSAKGMADDVQSTSRSMDSATEAFDSTERKALGFKDTLDGTAGIASGFGQIMAGDVFGGLITAGQGVADFAGGVANFLIPALSQGVAWLKATKVGTLATAAAQKVAAVATAAWTVAQRVLNTVLRANPIGLVITALFAIGAALVWAWNKSETFRKIVTGTWRAIVAGAQWLWGKVQSIWNAVTGFLGGAASRIGGFFSGMWDGMVGGLRSALNGVIWLLNRGIDAINGIINGVNTVSGVVGVPAIPNIGHIPTLHQGGTVPGAPGSETLALLQAGEQVTPAGQATRTVMLSSDGSGLSDLIVSTLRAEVRRQGGNVQFVIGA